ELMGLFDFFRKKKPVDDVDAESGGNPATCHCFVLCTEAELGDLSRAAEIVSEVFGADYSAEISKGNIVSVTHGESTVGFLAHVPMAIPNGEAEANADGNLLWPD